MILRRGVEAEHQIFSTAIGAEGYPEPVYVYQNKIQIIIEPIGSNELALLGNLKDYADVRWKGYLLPTVGISEQDIVVIDSIQYLVMRVNFFDFKSSNKHIEVLFKKYEG